MAKWLNNVSSFFHDQLKNMGTKYICYGLTRLSRSETSFPIYHSSKAIGRGGPTWVPFIKAARRGMILYGWWMIGDWWSVIEEVTYIIPLFHLETSFITYHSSTMLCWICTNPVRPPARKAAKREGTAYRRRNRRTAQSCTGGEVLHLWVPTSFRVVTFAQPGVEPILQGRGFGRWGGR